MQQIIKYCIAALALLTVGCHRQEICKWEGVSNSAKVEVILDWSDSGLDLSEVSNISIYAYPSSGESPYLRISGDIDSAYIYLPVGSYSLLVMSDMVGDILGVTTSGVDSFDLFAASATPRSSTSGLYYTPSSGEVVAQEIGQMASWYRLDVDILDEMISCSYCDDQPTDDTAQILLVAEMGELTTQCQVVAEVDNLDNATTVQCTLRGLSSGLYIASGDPIPPAEESDEILYNFNLDERSYSSGSSTNGTIWGETTTFGHNALSDPTYELIIDVVLLSGEAVSFTRDVTTQITEQVGERSITINLSGDDDKIVLSVATGTGFGVDEWGENRPLELL